MEIVVLLIVVVVIIIFITILCVCWRRLKKKRNTPLLPLTIAKFLDGMKREKPIRFTSKQLKVATKSFSNELGSGGFGKVYKGVLSNGTEVAVKVLNGSSDKSIKEQFMAEVSTMGRTHHFNLIKLYGFCFERKLRALVYEFMVNGSLDNHLFKTKKKDKILGFEKLHEIAVGTARGIAYLHEDCPQRIVHYDIKPGNILLDSKFCPKVADFGLAKLCNRDKSYITMTGGRGTPGYAAPELWMPLQVTYKCDVYSFGMLLFEIISRRRNMDVSRGDSEKWFPLWAWEKYEKKELKDVMKGCGIKKKKHKKVMERMVKVALCCVQYMPKDRPTMSMVVKMLEGVVKVLEPLNPFTHMVSGDNDQPSDSLSQMNWNGSSCSSSEVSTNDNEDE